MHRFIVSHLYYVPRIPEVDSVAEGGQ